MTAANRVRVVNRGWVAIVVACLVLSSACTKIPLQAVSSFAVATDSLAESSRQAYELVDESRVTREMYDVASDPTQVPTDKTFAPLVSPQDEATHQALQLRFALLDSLGSYAGALRVLCETDFASEIDEAATDLNGALVGLRDTYKDASGNAAPLGDTQIQLIATAVATIGKEVVEAQRRKAVRTIIMQVDPAVQLAAELLSRDLGRGSSLAQYVQSNFSNAYGSTRTVYLRQRQSMTFEERLAALEYLRTMKQAELGSGDFFDSVSQGAAAIGKGHGEMARAVSDDDFNVKGLASTVGEIVKRAKEAKKFYQTLAEANAGAAS